MSVEAEFPDASSVCDSTPPMQRKRSPAWYCVQPFAADDVTDDGVDHLYSADGEIAP